MSFLNKGFTLVELMISVAIVALLAAIAIPAYQQYILESRRTDAISALTGAAAEQELFFTFDNKYSKDISQLGGNTSREGYYRLSVIATDTTFILRAVPSNGSSQASDTSCLSITLDHLGTRLPAECW